MSKTPALDTSVQEQIQALASELATMRAELSALHNTPRTSLKQHNRCPSCQSTSILHCNEIRDYSAEGHTPMSIQLNGVFRKRSVGTFEVYICRQCELAEWYVRGAGDIQPDKLDKGNRKNIRIIDSDTPSSGPFR